MKLMRAVGRHVRDFSSCMHRAQLTKYCESADISNLVKLLVGVIIARAPGMYSLPVARKVVPPGNGRRHRSKPCEPILVCRLWHLVTLGHVEMVDHQVWSNAPDSLHHQK